MGLKCLYFNRAYLHFSMLCKKENCKLIILIIFTHIKLALWLIPCIPKTMLAACLWDIQRERPSGITKGLETACRTSVCSWWNTHCSAVYSPACFLQDRGFNMEPDSWLIWVLRSAKCNLGELVHCIGKGCSSSWGNVGFLPSWYRDPLVVEVMLDGTQLKVYHRVVIYRLTDFCGPSRAPLHRALCHSVRTSSLNILENIIITFLQHKNKEMYNVIMVEKFRCSQGWEN